MYYWWQPYCTVAGLCIISFSIGVWLGGSLERRFSRAWESAAKMYGVRSAKSRGRDIPEMSA